MQTYSTRGAAKKIEVSLMTLMRWISGGMIEAPKLSRVGGVKVRLWTDRDIKRVRKQRRTLYHPEKVRVGKRVVKRR